MFNISKSLDGKPQSVQGELPWINISHAEAIRVAEHMEQSESIESHLTFDEEYDLVLKWFVSSKAASYEELYIDSTDLGNYWNSEEETNKLAKTGSCEEWCLNNIYDFAGNVHEWTKNNKCAVLRGGSFNGYGTHVPASFREDDDWASHFPFVYIGFRVVLYIK